MDRGRLACFCLFILGSKYNTIHEKNQIAEKWTKKVKVIFSRSPEMKPRSSLLYKASIFAFRWHLDV